MQAHFVARCVTACLVGIASGFVLVTVPDILSRGRPESLFALVDSAVKDMSPERLLLLLAGGFLWGLVLKWPYSLCAAACQLGSLPAFAVVEIWTYPTSHNLWAFEFSIYVFLSIIPLLGMSAGLMLRRIFTVKVVR